MKFLMGIFTDEPKKSKQKFVLCELRCVYIIKLTIREELDFERKTEEFHFWGDSLLRGKNSVSGLPSNQLTATEVISET